MKQAKLKLATLFISIFVLSLPIFAKNTENTEIMFDKEILEENIVSNMGILKELINENMPPQSGPNKKLSRAQIEYIALKLFIYYRNNSFYRYKFRSLQNLYIEDGYIKFTSKGLNNWNKENTKQYSTKINIDEKGNFSFLLGAYEEFEYTGNRRASNGGKIEGIRRLDGYYDIYLISTDYYSNNNGKCLGNSLCDSKGNIINQEGIRRNTQSYLQKELDKIQYLSDTNKNMISALLAGNDIYDIDYVQTVDKYTIYADKLDSNIEIRFIKTDAKTIYGVYIVSKNDNSQVQESNGGSEIYAFKYSDESTSKKQRIKLMTKRVVQYDFDEQYPSTDKYTTGTKGKEGQLSEEFTKKTGLLNRKIQNAKLQQLDSIYEDFMCEGVIYTTYTRDDNGKFYKNQQLMF